MRERYLRTVPLLYVVFSGVWALLMRCTVPSCRVGGIQMGLRHLQERLHFCYKGSYAECRAGRAICVLTHEELGAGCGGRNVFVEEKHLLEEERG